jgi:hypothetical protein
MRKTTGKFDVNGKEIFVGDRVIKSWFWFQGDKCAYRVHTITEKPSHMMADGNMHDDGGGKIFCLGRYYNFWEGKEVEKVDDNYPFQDDELFTIKNGTPTPLNGEDVFGSDYITFKERMDRVMAEYFFGPNNNKKL